MVIILKRDQEGTNEPRAPTPKSSCVRARGGSAPGVWEWRMKVGGENLQNESPPLWRNRSESALKKPDVP